jgi:hypothetical protein
MFLLRCKIPKEIAIFDRNRNNPRTLSQLTLAELGKVAAHDRTATFPSRRWTIQPGEDARGISTRELVAW